MDKLAKMRRPAENTSKLSDDAKFESDLLKSNEDIALQSRESLQTFVWRLLSLRPLPYPRP